MEDLRIKETKRIKCMTCEEKDDIILAKRQVSEKIINKRFGNYIFLCEWVK